MNKIKPGTLAGTIDDKGYLRIKIDKKFYRAHQLAFLYQTGSVPKLVDHEDRNRINNRFLNLRSADRSQNAVNRGLGKNSTTGVSGVRVHQATGKFMARVAFRKQTHYLGLFTTLKEAQEAVEICRLNLHGEFAFIPHKGELNENT